MLSIIIGGSGSGKSAFAEDLVCRLPGRRIYIATMTARDPESLQRIARHRQARAGREFETLERGRDLAGAAESESELPARANVLLEDLSNLLANEMFHPEGGGIDAVRAGIKVLKDRGESLTVVTNEIFSDGGRYDGMTELYLRNLAMLNRELAREADLVAEVVCGLPNVLKGNLP